MELSRAVLEEQLRAELLGNPSGSALLLSLFFAAVRSPKASLLETPMPALAGESNPDELLGTWRRAMEGIPRGPGLPERLQTLPDGSVELLHFLLFPSSHRSGHLRGDHALPWPLRAEQRPVAWLEELASPLRLCAATRPDLVFEIVPHPDDPFEPLARAHGTTLEYHGSPSENLHSILRRGLLTKYGRRMIYGDGLYFTSDLRVARQFIETTADVYDTSSALRQPFGCLAVFEVLKRHPAVRRPDPLGPDAAGLAVHGGGLPLTYIVVASPEFVRLRYLLVYLDSSAEPRSSRARMVSKLLIAYVVVLAFLAVFGSSLWHLCSRYLHRFYLQRSQFKF